MLWLYLTVLLDRALELYRFGDGDDAFKSNLLLLHSIQEVEVCTLKTKEGNECFRRVESKNFIWTGYASFMFNCWHNVIQQRLKWNPNRKAKSCPFRCAHGTLLRNNGEKVAVFKVPRWSNRKGLDFTSLCPNCSSKCSNGWFKCCTYVTPGHKWNLTETKTLIFHFTLHFLEESVHISSLKSWNCKQRYHVQYTHITGVRPFWVNSHFLKCTDHWA